MKIKTTGLRSRRLDKRQVPQTGQGIIYGVVLGAVHWTELDGVAGTSGWTELRRGICLILTGEESCFELRKLDRTVAVGGCRILDGIGNIQ